MALEPHFAEKTTAATKDNAPRARNRRSPARPACRGGDSRAIHSNSAQFNQSIVTRQIWNRPYLGR